MSLSEELERVASLAVAHGEEGDVVSGVIATEQAPGRRVYLCAFDGADGYRSWLALREDGALVEDRAELRAAVSIAALCEVAEDAAGGGALDTLIERLEDVRVRESPPGIEEAQEAAEALRALLGEPPQVATPDRLDAIGAATRRLEQELDPSGGSPFASALRSSQAAVSELQREIEAGYRVPLSLS